MLQSCHAIKGFKRSSDKKTNEMSAERAFFPEGDSEMAQEGEAGWPTAFQTSYGDVPHEEARARERERVGTGLPTYVTHSMREDADLS